jgi:hypothetical protein
MTNPNKLADALRSIVDPDDLTPAEYAMLFEAVLDALAEHDAQPAQGECEPLQDETQGLPAGWRNCAGKIAIEAPQPAPAPVQVDVTDAMVRRFLNWRLPGHIKPDGVYPPRDAPYPMTGTNLLDYDAAKAMLEWVLTDMSPQAQLKRVLDGAFAPDDQHPPAPAADGAGELPPLPLDRKYPDDGNGDDDSYNAGWNACLDAIAALRQPVPDAVRELSEQWRRRAHITSGGWRRVVLNDCADELESALASQQESRNAD